MDWGGGHTAVAPRLTDSYLLKWMLQWLQRAHQECLINTHSKEMDTDDSLKSCRVTTGGQVLGVGVWLCFICCPLQGGSYLQPTHEPVNPKPVLLNLDPKKLFLTSVWAGQWHYTLDR